MGIEEIGLELRVVSNLIYDKMNKLALKSENLTMHQCLILQYLSQNSKKEVVQKDIEQLFSIKRSTANQMLRTLEERGYIARTVSAEDSRKNIITPTKTGIAASKHLTDNMCDFMKKLHGDITRDEIEQFEKPLFKLRNTIE